MYMEYKHPPWLDRALFRALLEAHICSTSSPACLLRQRNLTFEALQICGTSSSIFPTTSPAS